MNRFFLKYGAGILGICSLLIVACSPQRKVIRQPLRELGDSIVFAKLKQNELKYEQFSAKFTASMRIDKKHSTIGGQVRILCDSVIWVSLSPALGIEAARMLITKDSVKFMNRIDNTYMITDFAFINNYLNSGFDFDMLQALIMGNDLRYYENDQFKASIDNSMYKLHTLNRHKLRKFIRNNAEYNKVLVQSIWLNPESGKIQALHIKELDKDNKKLEVKYEGFLDLGGQLFPQHAEYKISAEKEITIVIDFSKVKINEAVTTPFTIPANYSKLR